MYGLTKPSVQHLLRKAGVKSASGLIYEETIGVFLFMLDSILQRVVVFVEHERRRTAMPSDVKRAVESVTGLGLLVHDETVTRCAARRTAASKTDQQRTRKGIGALRNIRFYQRQSDCVYFPKTAFHRLVKDRVNLRWNKVGLDHLQLFLEAHLVHLLEKANLAAIHASRETLMPRDILLARSLSDNPLSVLPVMTL